MSVRTLVVFLCATLFTFAAQATCPPSWAPTFPSAEFNSTVNTSITFDDGHGPALWVGGAFTSVSGVPANFIAKYDGTHWTQPGRGFNNQVYAFGVYDNHLYAAGSFTTTTAGVGSITVNRIARWSGSDWETVGTGTNNGMNSNVYALATYNNELYLGGLFTTAGTVTGVNRIAKWNGTAWSAVGTGLNAEVDVLKVLIDASGTKLWVSGLFTATGAGAALHVATWDGTTLSAVGSGLSGGATRVDAMETYNGAVYAAGVFTTSGTNALSNLARWTGSQWVDVGGGSNGALTMLLTYNDGAGTRLFVGGNFTTLSAGTVTGSPRMVRWNGISWVNTGNGIQNGIPLTATAFDDGTGSDLFLGGTFTAVGVGTLDGASVAVRLAKWNGTFFSSAGRGLSSTVTNFMASTNDATPSLLVVGDITRAGTQQVNQVALFNGSSWSALGTAKFNFSPLTAIDYNGTYFVGGNFTQYNAVTTTRICTWNGTTFIPTGTTINASVRAFARHGNDLYAGGDFTVPVGRVGKFTAGTWSPLGVGIGNGQVLAMASFQGKLVVAGTFTVAGGVTANRIAMWDGTNWSPLGAGMNNTISALAVQNGELFAAGAFTTAGTGPASRVARWDGSTWSDAGGGMNNTVNDMIVINDDGTEMLFATGAFTVASGGPASFIAMWNGCRWAPVGTGLLIAGTSLAAVNSGPAKGVYTSGTFSSAGGEPANNIARIQTCTACPADLDDGTVTGHPDGGVTIDDLLFFLVAFEGGDISADLDNGSGTGVCDGGVTIDDLLFFLVHFESGC